MEGGSGKSYPVEYYAAGHGRLENRPIRLFIVDDHIPFRSELCRALKEQADIVVSGEAGSTPEAMQAIDEVKPNVLLVEMELAGIDGVETTRMLLQKLPKARIILMSLHNDEERVLEGLRAGALAHISKFSQPEEFACAIRSVDRGEAWIDMQTTARVLRELRRSYEAP